MFKTSFSNAQLIAGNNADLYVQADGVCLFFHTSYTFRFKDDNTNEAFEPIRMVMNGLNFDQIGWENMTFEEFALLIGLDKNLIPTNVTQKDVLGDYFAVDSKKEGLAGGFYKFGTDNPNNGSLGLMSYNGGSILITFNSAGDPPTPITPSFFSPFSSIGTQKLMGLTFYHMVDINQQFSFDCMETYVKYNWLAGEPTHQSFTIIPEGSPYPNGASFKHKDAIDYKIGLPCPPKW